MTVLAALLGVGVHVLRALPGLVADHEDGCRHLPLRIALRIGATRLLVLSLAWTVLVLVALLVAGSAVGLPSSRRPGRRPADRRRRRSGDR